MSDEQDANEERECLHCLIVQLIDDFFAEYPAATGEPDTIVKRDLFQPIDNQ